MQALTMATWRRREAYEWLRAARSVFLDHQCCSGKVRGFPCCRQVRKTRHQLYKHIDGDYYGFRDEEDGSLLKAEAEAEAHLRKKVPPASPRISRVAESCACGKH